jgi:hypothetical protein
MSVATGALQVFILAGNRLMREALNCILSNKTEIRVVGASAFFPNVVAQISNCSLSVLLSDSAAMTLSRQRVVGEARAAIPATPHSRHRRHGSC